MEIKAGVRVLGVRPEIVLALMVMREIYTTHGQFAAFVVTSVVEGVHKRASLHYTGCAVDLRLPTADAAQIVASGKAALGDDFDVVIEADHLHLEFQPKTPY